MRKIAFVVALLVWPAAAPAQVSPQSGELDVRIRIVASCDITGGGGGLANAVLDFGTHGLLTSAVEDQVEGQTEALVINCTPGANYTLTFNAGLHSDTIQTRRMANKEDSTLTIPYNLWDDAGRGENVLGQISGTATGGAQTITVYGAAGPAVAPNAPPAPGEYTDTVTITLTF